MKEMWGGVSAGIDMSLTTPEKVFASIKLILFCAVINLFITLEMGNFKAAIWCITVFLCYILCSEKINLFLHAASLLSLPYNVQHIAQSVESQFVCISLEAAWYQLFLSNLNKKYSMSDSRLCLQTRSKLSHHSKRHLTHLEYSDWILTWISQLAVGQTELCEGEVGYTFARQRALWWGVINVTPQSFTLCYNSLNFHSSFIKGCFSGLLLRIIYYSSYFSLFP